MNSRLALVAAVVIGLALGLFATIPPSPAGEGSDPRGFSAARAMHDVRTIAVRPHPAGSPENEAVRAYLIERMRGLGMETSTEQASASEAAIKRLNRWSGRNDTSVPLTNVIGVLPGRDRRLPALLLMAHHDTVWGSPGAADDTAGVAAILEVVRAVKERGGGDRDLMVLFTDGEELGLEGAKHFFAASPLRERVGAIVNLEARGGGGRAAMFQTSRDNGEAMAIYAAAVQRPSASSLAAFVYSVLPNDTDLTPALEGGYTAYNLAFIGRSGLYHSPLITPDRLDQGAVQDIGNQTLDLANALLARDGMPGKAPDRVFFDFVGLMTVHFPVWAGWAVLALALAGFAWTARRDGAAGAGEGAVRTLLLLVLTAALTYAFNWLSLGGAKGEYYDRLAAIPRLEVMAALACLSAFMAVIGSWRIKPGSVLGFAAPLFVVALAGQVLAPTAIYFVSLPLMLVALALALPAGALRIAGLSSAAVLVIAYMLPLGHFVMQGVGPGMPYASVLPAVLAVLAILPLWEPLRPRFARLVAGFAAAVALAISLWVLLDPPAETSAVYADTKS